jgi:hypothetical protein
MTETASHVDCTLVILILSEAKGRTYALLASCRGPFGFAQGRLSAASNSAQDDNLSKSNCDS